MGRDEQIEEREVLESIFSDEITDISDTAYRISIKLDVVDENGNDLEPPAIILQVSYPEEYPDVAPDLEISGPPNASKHPRFDMQEDRNILLEALQSSIAENLGMAMVFTIVSTLKECAETLISERAAAAQAEIEREIARADEEENRKFQGTLVTRESFLKWREMFQKEMDEEEQRKREEKEAEDKKRRLTAKEEKKMTGRQLWERGLAEKGDYDEEGDEDILVGTEKMKIAA
ncbi:Ubiquitin-conjugating enzyme/RWD-like protein [Elaphomyces granulatus]|jgi:hypothetical protein